MPPRVLQIGFNKANILVRPGQTDIVAIETNLPNACFPFTGPQDFVFKVSAGRGRLYVETHFPGLPIEVVYANGLIRPDATDQALT